MNQRLRLWLREPNAIPRGVRILVVSLVAVIGVAGGALAVHHTYQPSYCANCHASSGFNFTAPSFIDMPNGIRPGRAQPGQPGPSLIKVPNMPNVSCLDCHLPPGVNKALPIENEHGLNVFTANPKVVSANCVKCHSNIPQTNSTVGFKFNVDHINIPHKLMLAQGANCVTCHANVRHDFRPEPTNRPPMQACFRSGCHIQNTPLGNCTNCHVNGPPTGKTEPRIQDWPAPARG